jgi:hypothetical protein
MEHNEHHAYDLLFKPTKIHQKRLKTKCFANADFAIILFSTTTTHPPPPVHIQESPLGLLLCKQSFLVQSILLLCWKRNMIFFRIQVMAWD